MDEGPDGNSESVKMYCKWTSPLPASLFSTSVGITQKKKKKTIHTQDDNLNKVVFADLATYSPAQRNRQSKSFQPVRGTALRWKASKIQILHYHEIVLSATEITSSDFSGTLKQSERVKMLSNNTSFYSAAEASKNCSGVNARANSDRKSVEDIFSVYLKLH